MNRAIRIDIDTELEAMSQGQCGACRTGGTHKRTEDCSKPEFKEHYAQMVYCVICEHLYNRAWNKTCPICEKGEK